MFIPEFPASRDILIEDKPFIDALLKKKRPEISAYTFTNMYVWRNAYNVRLSSIADFTIVIYDRPQDKVFLEPLGDGSIKRAIEEVFKRENSRYISLAYAHAGTAKLFEGCDGCQVILDRNNSDYLYLSYDLIHLNGRKYDAKRNFINRFKQSVDYEYIKLDAETAAECHRFAERWCEDRACMKVNGLRQEQCAVYQMLMNFGKLGVTGGAIRVGGEIVAFTLGELLNSETMVIHVEKGDSGYSGIYQAINNEFLSREAAELKYVNREQDLGVPGLRKAKESYHPVKLIETYRINVRT